MHLYPEVGKPLKESATTISESYSDIKGGYPGKLGTLRAPDGESMSHVEFKKCQNIPLPKLSLCHIDFMKSP